jgi:DNA topoisomerase-2
MAIWSLTQERVDKLLKQIGDKEAEIDALIKLTPRDLWNTDLDAFVEEWNTQLQEDADRIKKIARMDRRGSKKLKVAGKGKGTKKRRKMGDSDSEDDSGSDFGPARKKAAVSKPKPGGLLSYLRKDEEPAAKKPATIEAPKKAAAPKQNGLLGYLKKEPTPATDGAMDIDEPAPAKAAPAQKKARPAATKIVKKPTPVPIDSDDDDTDVFAAVAKEASKKPSATITNGRAARVAAKKAPKYTLGDSDEDDSDDAGDAEDDSLGDVSNMVKTIGGDTNERPLFSTSGRPGSNGNARPSSATGVNGKKKSTPIELDDDETNYEGLMPQGSPQKPAPRNVNDTLMGSDDEDEFGFSVSKPKAAAPKPKAKSVTKLAPKPKAAPKPKTAPAALVAKKTTALSPAAKAYAAKFAKVKDTKPAPAAKKAKKQVDTDDEMEDADDLADELLSDSDEDQPTPKPRAAPAARPGRRAAAAKPAKYMVSDDEADSDEVSEASFDEDSE